METLYSAKFKMQSHLLVWREVELRLSYERHWTTHEAPVLSVSRRRSCFSGAADRVLVDQIPLGPQLQPARLLPQSEQDARRCRFTVEHGKRRTRFQATDKFTCATYCGAIAGAIERTEKAITTTNTKPKWTNDVRLKQSDRDHKTTYTRDSNHRRLIRLHQPDWVAAAPVTEEQEVEDEQKKKLITKIDTCDEATTVSSDVVKFGHLMDAVQHNCNLIASDDVRYDGVTVTIMTDHVALGHLVEAVRHMDRASTKTVIKQDGGNSLYETVSGETVVFGHLFNEIADVDDQTSAAAAISKGFNAQLGEEIAFGQLVDAVQYCSSAIPTAHEVVAPVQVRPNGRRSDLARDEIMTICSGTVEFGHLFDAAQHNCACASAIHNSEAAMHSPETVPFAHLFEAVKHSCGSQVIPSEQEQTALPDTRGFSERSSNIQTQWDLEGRECFRRRLRRTVPDLNGILPSDKVAMLQSKIKPPTKLTLHQC
ncbi:hypothetical protein BBJ29_009741 [Phytophthora kernoviae]|uniref:Uncharacterized protein n=1 Tax=Phytophthora kernoviae TaxID=325452 RepID=A0A3R7JS73_9STRA|nr:hypothetical protein BBJ29_009741 [Phytophthora kernoviae]